MASRKIDGLEVENSGRSLRIDITEDDIKKGKPLDPTACAAARCLLRSTNAEAVKAHRHSTLVQIGKKWRRYKTSSSLRMEMIIYDRGGKFMPGYYDLAAVPLSQVMTKKKSKSAPRKGKEARLSRRRLVIPGVRRSLRSSEEGEQ